MVGSQTRKEVSNDNYDNNNDILCLSFLKIVSIVGSQTRKERGNNNDNKDILCLFILIKVEYVDLLNWRK